jgi:hypothetical protein
VGTIKNIFLGSKDMGIFKVRLDSKTKVGAVQFSEKSLKSEAEIIIALKDNVKDLDDGMYSVHPNNELFARFNLVDHKILKLEKWSENTGAAMPCWNYFD